MSDWENEIEESLKALKEVQPTDFELRRWKRAAGKEKSAALFRRPIFFQKAVQFAAAGFIGFLLGWAVFGSKGVSRSGYENFVAEANSNATVEVIFSK